MTLDVTIINDQPIAAGFFGEGRWLTEFVTPSALDVKALHDELVTSHMSLEDKIRTEWDWVADRIQYVPFVRAQLEVNGKVSQQSDYWQLPSQLIQTRIGNCANKAFLLGSLVRNDLPSEDVRVVFGNLFQDGVPGGHAWVEARVDGQWLILESTRGDMMPLVPTRVAEIYEPVMYFNDVGVIAIPGRTLLEPFSAVYADWLRDYLDWCYIEGRK